jgi:hypothetical protein
MSAVAQNQVAPASNFAGTLIDILDRVEYRRVPIEDEHDPVYRLRYEAYRREDFVPFSPSGTVLDEFDNLPNAFCYGIYIDGQLVSSLRIHHLTYAERRSPSYSVFKDVLDPLLDQHMTIIDPGRFTADFEASLAYPALPFLTLRIAVMATWHFRVKFCLSSVRPEHAAFYRRVFNSTRLSEARFYHGLSFPMEMWACDCPVVYPNLLNRYPFFRSTEPERQQLFAPPHRSPLWIHPSVRAAQLEPTA